MRTSWARLAPLFFVALVTAGSGCTDGSASSRTATIWSNGNPGCWGDHGDTCDSGGSIGRLIVGNAGIGGSTVAVVDDITGGVPSLQLTGSSSGGSFFFCINGLSGCNQRDLRQFKNGHLQFDIRLESPLVTEISITLFPPLTVTIPVESLNQATFVHLSIPLTPDLFGTDGPPVNQVNVFEIAITSSSATPAAVTLNDIKWTTD